MTYLLSTNAPPFVPFPKMYRYSREVIITEKIDGTNGVIHITDNEGIIAGSRNQWLGPDGNNFGFGKWVFENTQELLRLGPGTHYGEWWGAGIQRRYGLANKRFSLFNVSRWADDALRPRCCHVVPELWRGLMDNAPIQHLLLLLKANGSKASPGFMKPEGIVIYHVASGVGFKKTIESDEKPKGRP